MKYLNVKIINVHSTVLKSNITSPLPHAIGTLFPLLFFVLCNTRPFQAWHIFTPHFTQPLTIIKSMRYHCLLFFRWSLIAEQRINWTMPVSFWSSDFSNETLPTLHHMIQRVISVDLASFFRTSTTNFASQLSSISGIATMSYGTWANSSVQCTSEFLFVPHSSHTLIA